MHELRRHADDAISATTQRLIPARVSPEPLGVTAAIHLNDKACGEGCEVCDVARDRDLAAKEHAEPTATDGGPEALFGRRGSKAHLAGASSEKS